MDSRALPGLTRKQAEALAFVRSRIARNEPAPSLQEIADVLGLKARSGAHRVIEVLIDYGFLQRVGRALQVCKLAADLPEITVIERTVVKVVTRPVIREPEAPHPARDRAKTQLTRRKRTYVLELDGDVHRRIQKLARKSGMPPERIIMEATRDFIMG